MRYPWGRVVAGGLILAGAALGGCTETDRVADFSKELEKSVVLVRVTKQPYKAATPWLRKKVSTEFHLGTVVRPPGMGKHILLTAWALTWHKNIAMQKYGNTRRINLIPAYVDYNTNLALVVPEDDSVLKDMKPVTPGKDQPPGTEVTLFTDFNHLRINGYKGYISATGVFEAPTSSYQIANYLLKINKKSLGWSEPVFSEKKLIGLSGGQGQDFIYALPSFLIEHLLEDFSRKRKGGPSGFPETGLLTQSLTTPELRKILNLPASGKGSRIALVETGSPFFGKVKVDDVLIEAQGSAIDDRQTYRHPVWGNTPWVVLYNRLYAGDPFTVVVSRGGKHITFREKLTAFDPNTRLIRQNNYDEQPPYLIYAGLVIQELSLEYLKTWGKYWEQEAKSALLYQWLFKNFEHSHGKKLLIITKILSDEINIGYELFTNRMIEKVNGKKVDSLHDLSRALSSPVMRNKVPYSRLSMTTGRGEIIILHAKVPEAHRRIAGQYHIPDSAPFFAVAATGESGSED